MNNSDHTSTLLTALADEAQLSQKALYDKRLSPRLLGLLLFLCNQPKKHTPVEVIIDRFGVNRSWWTRNFKLLIAAGYGRYIKTSSGRNQFNHTYIVTDDPEYLNTLYPLFQDAKIAHNQDAKIAPENQPAPPEVEPTFQDAKIAHRIDQDITPSLSDPRIRKQMKWLDPATISQKELETKQFYASLGWPLYGTDDPWLWQEATKPGMIAWARATRKFIGWDKASIINRKLGATPDEQTLQTAYEEWITNGYNPGNLRGIMEWYQALRDDPNATPWERSHKGQTNGAKTRSNTKSGKVHGVSQVEYNPDEFSTA